MIKSDARKGPRRVGPQALIWLGFALASLMVACVTDGDSSSNADSASDAVFSGDLEIIVPPGEDGSFPADLWVGCKNGPEFQISDLDVIVPLAEADPGGVAEAIDTFLSDGEGQFWPQDGWLILRETDDEMLLVHNGDSEVAFMRVSRVGGEWEWSGAKSTGSCPLYYLVPEGLNTVDWRLSQPVLLGPLTTALKVIVTERNCVSGQELGDRLLGPQIVMSGDQLRMAFAAQPPPGDAFTCPSNPETHVTVELPERLGYREIIEGLELGISLEDYLP